MPKAFYKRAEGRLRLPGGATLPEGWLTEGKLRVSFRAFQKSGSPHPRSSRDSKGNYWTNFTISSGIIPELTMSVGRRRNCDRVNRLSGD